jgi:hypothetical protein
MSELAPENSTQLDQTQLAEVLLEHGLEIEVPAHMLEFGSADEFKTQCNNFPRYFDIQNIGGLPEKLIHSRVVFKRFNALFPFQTYYLQAMGGKKTWLQDSQVWQELFDAYTIMSALMDVSDPHVMRHGSVNAHYLIR